uniref:ATP synthase complex subunit 8 n=1 Tax=Tuxedo elongatus TaxID=2127003 RepID=A0A514LQE5_9HEMI|nr:ATP synthase F0 subunit 8 [Tuxedo elongatus]
MPQMSPMWWSLLFTSFLAAYLLIMICMYTYNIYSIASKKESNKNVKNINWKW